MSSRSKAETLNLVQASFINSAHNLSTYVQQAEFQHLRTEFERILDDYLEKSTQVSEDEMPGLIHDTTQHINVVLKKAAAFTRNQDEDDGWFS